MSRATVTACLIVRDEQERLPAALASVAWCDEIVVVDSGSTDDTVELAKAAGALVVEHPWAGFGAQRNVAIDHANSDWILEVDADERVSPELRTDIERFLVAPPADVRLAMVPLRDHLLGRALGPSAKYPCYRARLFRRGAYRHDPARLVHEGLWPNERTWAMRGDLEHEYAATWSEALHDRWAYSRLESGHLEPLGAAWAYAVAILVRPAAKVVFRLVVDGGWQDGWRGLVRILLEAAGDSVVFLRRALGRIPARRGTLAEQAFGRRVWAAGPVRIVVVDRGSRSLPFLRAAHRAGADVALLTDAAVDGDDWLHVWRVPRLHAFGVIRGLDAISQMRPVDQLVVGRALVARRALAVNARGVLPPVPLSAADDAAGLVARLEAAAR